MLAVVCTQWSLQLGFYCTIQLSMLCSIWFCYVLSIVIIQTVINKKPEAKFKQFLNGVQLDLFVIRSGQLLRLHFCNHKALFMHIASKF